MGKRGTTKGGGGDDGNNRDEGGKFSLLFVGEWEKEESWKYVDIWFLIKSGIPKDLRPGLWKDLLKR